MNFWNRDNDKLPDVLAWARLFEDPGYRFVAYDVEGNHAVSTLWMGVDLAHGFAASGEGAMIFESAYLTDGVVIDRMNWHSEAGALGGHRMMCVKLLGRPARTDGRDLERRVAEHRMQRRPA